jgi:hypothetical protein
MESQQQSDLQSSQHINFIKENYKKVSRRPRQSNHSASSEAADGEHRRSDGGSLPLSYDDRVIESRPTKAHQPLLIPKTIANSSRGNTTYWSEISMPRSLVIDPNQNSANLRPPNLQQNPNLKIRSNRSNELGKINMKIELRERTLRSNSPKR